jgi:hypothetical protein
MTARDAPHPAIMSKQRELSDFNGEGASQKSYPARPSRECEDLGPQFVTGAPIATNLAWVQPFRAPVRRRRLSHSVIQGASSAPGMGRAMK